eukprot:5744176-Pyramimonas_sp.AAC.1
MLQHGEQHFPASARAIGRSLTARFWARPRTLLQRLHAWPAARRKHERFIDFTGSGARSHRRQWS